MVDDGCSKGFPFHGIFGGLVQGSLCNANSTRSHWRTSLIKCSHCNLEPSSFANQYVFFRNNDILECDSSSVRSSLTHVHLLSTRSYSRSISIHNETSKSF